MAELHTDISKLHTITFLMKSGKELEHSEAGIGRAPHGHFIYKLTPLPAAPYGFNALEYKII